MLLRTQLEERQETPTQGIGRNPYMRDKARILHSAFFRRLQAKKQIHDVDVSDFGRTRLTHTLEVAQIATGIREVLNKKNDEKITKLLPDIFCIEAAALAHDLGHPPNGHGGEHALNYLMLNHGGFEGNAQTFRIATKLEESTKNWGLGLTRATLLGMLKYPAFYSNFQYSYLKTQEQFPKFSSYKPPKCIFDSEANVLDWVLEPFKADREKYCQIDKNMGKAKYFNFFSSIVDLADDIAYGVHDLEDAVALKLISKDEWEQWEKGKIWEKSPTEYNVSYENKKNTRENLFSIDSKARKIAISKMVHLFIANVKVKKQEEFENNFLDYNVVLPDFLKQSLKELKDFIAKKVIQRRENKLMEFKLQNIITKIFACLCSDPEGFLPEKYWNRIKKEKKKEKGNSERVICDYIAGMTDRYLIKLYRTLFSPDCGSIFDKM